MAELKRTKLVLRFNIGTEDEPKYKDVIFTRIAEDATDAAIQMVGAALAELYSYDMVDVFRINEVSLGE